MDDGQQQNESKIAIKILSYRFDFNFVVVGIIYRL